MEEKETQFTALGLVFGASLGAGFSFVLQAPVYLFAGIGAGFGLVLGAALDAYHARRQPQ